MYIKSILIILYTLSDNGQLIIEKEKETQHTYIQIKISIEKNRGIIYCIPIKQ